MGDKNINGVSSSLVGYIMIIITIIVGTLYANIKIREFPYIDLNRNVGLEGILISSLFILLLFSVYKNLSYLHATTMLNGWNKAAVRRVYVLIFLFAAYIVSAKIIYSYNCFEPVKISCSSLIFIQFFLHVISTLMIFGMMFLAYIILRR